MVRPLTQAVNQEGSRRAAGLQRDRVLLAAAFAREQWPSEGLQGARWERDGEWVVGLYVRNIWDWKVKQLRFKTTNWSYAEKIRCKSRECEDVAMGSIPGYCQKRVRWQDHTYLPRPLGIGRDGPGLGAPGQRSFDQHLGDYVALKGKLKGIHSPTTVDAMVPEYFFPMRRT